MTKKQKPSFKKRTNKPFHPKKPKYEQNSVKLEHPTPIQPLNPTKPISKPPKNSPTPIKKQFTHNLPAKQPHSHQKQSNDPKKKNLKRARLIIRNLVFDINEKHIRKLMEPFGEIKEIAVPMHPEKNINRGFAFVQYANKNMCLKAIKQLNQSKFKGRTIILDMSVAKDRYLTEKLVEQNNQNVINQGEQLLNQNKEDQIKEQNIQQEQEEQNLEEEEEEDEDDEDQQQENEIQQQEVEQQEDYGDEIFIRNIPMSITEEQLFKIFRKYGKINFAKIVMNKTTNKPKGTAFVKFHDAEVAKKLIEYSRSYQMYLLKKMKFFQPDPSINLQIDGMIMKIFPVQSRQSISDKQKERIQNEKNGDEKKKPMKKIKKIQDLIKTDLHNKRKLKLALEGFWRPTQQMDEKDYERFKNYEKQKIEKLKNPNNSISDTRIILKFLEKSVTELDLRNLCRDFMKESHIRFNALTWCKLMLDHNRQKSAGYAFIEFKTHQTSQKFIKYVIANPKKLMNRNFLIQYAIQDSKVLLKLKNKDRRMSSFEKNDRRNHQQNRERNQIKKPRKIGKKISKMNKRVKETHTSRKIKNN